MESVIKTIRKIVYRWGFRPSLGSIFYSPSLDFYYAGQHISDVLAEGMTKAMAYSEEDYERDQKLLGELSVDKDLPTGIVTNLHHVPVTNMDNAEAVMQAVRDIMDGRDWFEEAPTKKTDSSFKFFCPLCGVGMGFNLDRVLYECLTHGFYDMAIGRKADGYPEVIIKSVRLRHE